MVQRVPDVTTLPVSSALIPVQRVRDRGLRDTTDVEMDALKERTALIFGQLSAEATNWSAKWGERAKEAAEEQVRKKINREKGESIEKQAIKKLWDQLEPEEKREIVWEATKAAVTLFGTVVSETSLPSRSGSSRESSSTGFSLPSFGSRRSPKESSSSDSGFGSAVITAVSSLGDLTTEDAKRAYEFFKAYRKTRNKIEEFKQEVITTAGKVGEEAGAFAGTLRDEHEFEKLIKAHAGEFKGARSAYKALRRSIEENEDAKRYQEELDMLHNAFDWLTGPQLAFMLNGNIVAVKRLEYPKLCADTRSDIKASSRSYDGLIETGLKTANKLRYGGSDSAESQLAVAQEKAASAIRRIARQSWKKVTTWGSVPTGVNKIRKLKDDTDGRTYLGLAKAKAQATGRGGSNRDAEVTQPFYDAVKGMIVDDAGSLGATTTEVKRLERALASK